MSSTDDSPPCSRPIVEADAAALVLSIHTIFEIADPGDAEAERLLDRLDQLVGALPDGALNELLGSLRALGADAAPDEPPDHPLTPAPVTRGDLAAFDLICARAADPHVADQDVAGALTGLARRRALRARSSAPRAQRSRMAGVRCHARPRERRPGAARTRSSARSGDSGDDGLPDPPGRGATATPAVAR